MTSELRCGSKRLRKRAQGRVCIRRGLYLGLRLIGLPDGYLQEMS